MTRPSSVMQSTKKKLYNANIGSVAYVFYMCNGISCLIQSLSKLKKKYIYIIVKKWISCSQKCACYGSKALLNVYTVNGRSHSH